MGFAVAKTEMAASTLWTEQYERKVIDILKSDHSKTPKTREEYNVISTFQIATLAEVKKVTRRKNGKYMVTEQKPRKSSALSS